jgi:hypothetical protein
MASGTSDTGGGPDLDVGRLTVDPQLVEVAERLYRWWWGRPTTNVGRLWVELGEALETVRREGK